MLEFDGLTKRFGSVTALNGCTFGVQSGRITGFLGPNGDGKTTAMRAVFGLVRPDSGQGRWRGRPVGHRERLRFGYLPEERGVYPKMRVRDQLSYFGRLSEMSGAAADAAADRWLERLGLADRAGERVEVLSHGNQQRFQLALAVINDPELLVLDEPFSGLDPLAVDTMMELLRELAAAGAAVLFSSHQLDLVEDLCEEVAIINAGEVVVRGNVEALKDSAPIRHLELEVEGDPSQLLGFLDGVQATAMDGERLIAIIDADTDVRGFIAHAQNASKLRHFAYTTPSLSDLFREAVR